MIEARGQRLMALAGKAKVSKAFPLFIEMKMKSGAYSELCDAVKAYMLGCLRAAFPDQSFDSSQDILSAYEAQILELPNRTPNGVLMPKRDVMLEYNRIHSHVVKAFGGMQSGDLIGGMQLPPNVRVVGGNPDPKADVRPYASNKCHTDIWAGEPPEAILFVLPTIGDLNNTNVDYWEPDITNIEDFVQTLDDYSEGLQYSGNPKKYDARLHADHMYLIDAFTLHQTVRHGGGIRISIDLRIRPSQLVDSDHQREASRDCNYVSIDDWSAVGTKQLLVPSETMQECIARFSGDSASSAKPAGYEYIALP